MVLLEELEPKIPKVPDYDAYKFSFLPRSIRAWNSLPPEIIAIQNPDSYRNAIATALRKGTIEMTNNTARSNNYKARTDIPIPLF